MRCGHHPHPSQASRPDQCSVRTHRRFESILRDPAHMGLGVAHRACSGHQLQSRHGDLALVRCQFNMTCICSPNYLPPNSLYFVGLERRGGAMISVQYVSHMSGEPVTLTLRDFQFCPKYDLFAQLDHVIHCGVVQESLQMQNQNWRKHFNQCLLARIDLYARPR
jgi:hypothetical protein